MSTVISTRAVRARRGEAVHERRPQVALLLPEFNTLYVLIAYTLVRDTETGSDPTEVIER
jgi:hypothetical protein